MARKPLDLSTLHPETRLALTGRDPGGSEGGVNPPVQHASTIVIEDAADLFNPAVQTYARQGVAVHRALSAALVAVEGGAEAILAPSGLAACVLALMTFARGGGHLLVTDSVYGPTRRFCDRTLARMGVRTEYFDPRIGAGIAALIRDDTSAIFLESPGSQTFEIQDVPAIAAAAKARDVRTIIDNTWSAGVFFKPFDHGVDLSVQALTKYQGGHADLLCGAVLAREPALATRVYQTHRDLGLAVAPDDAYSALRGMRTLAVRLARQADSARQIAQRLSLLPQVARVLHPAMESHPDHRLWKRDFTGASGLFSIVLKPVETARLNAMLESLSLFAMGFSWGGYESLILPCDPQLTRTAVPWKAEGPLVRLSIGLEHPDDLIADLERGLASM
ncbi:MAG TPA: cystathionine beta-lyase [Caulobacterales bacterium]|jgi:cystathionine beta-lyase|nr:cystathionine beta-lyase [Caulobacterales bacterium]